jgi:hypothetical protein
MWPPAAFCFEGSYWVEVRVHGEILGTLVVMLSWRCCIEAREAARRIAVVSSGLAGQAGALDTPAVDGIIS